MPNDLLLTYFQSRDSSSINEKSEKGKQCFFGTCSSLPSLGAALKIKTEIMHVFIALFGSRRAQAVLLLIPIEEVQVHQRIFLNCCENCSNGKPRLSKRVQSSPKLFHSSNELFLSGLGFQQSLTSARVVLPIRT